MEQLAPFDQLMLLDARPGFGMCFFLECIVEGNLDQKRFKQSVQRAVQRHPKFCQRVSWHGHRAYWLPADVQPEIVWKSVTTPIDPWRAINLTSESGLRIVVRTISSEVHSITMVVHHAVCDGIAACEFMGDLWANYDGVNSSSLGKPVNQTCNSIKLTLKRPVAKLSLRHVSDQVQEVLVFARFTPSALEWMSPDLGEAQDNSIEPPYASIEIDKARTLQLRAAASTRKASLNDLILAAVMRAAVAWNERAGNQRAEIRVAMPVNTRAPRQHKPVNNGISYAFLDRSRDECRDQESLVCALSMASRWIQASGVASGFMETIRFLSKSPVLLKAITRLPICFSTVIVSNLGNVSRRMRTGLPKIDGCDTAADLMIRSFRGAPPLRPRTRASVGVLAYAGATTICCLCSAGKDQRASGREFLDLVRRELDGFL